MLTADHVHARRSKGALKLTSLKPEQRQRALTLATSYYELARSHVGQTREELGEAWKAVEVKARERKIADGLKKLIEDKLEFEVGGDGDPVALRRDVFERATARRQALEIGERFDRDALLAEIAAEHSLDTERLESELFADLRGAHVLKSAGGPPPAALIAGYDMEQARAVLLRAVRIVVTVRDASPDELRLLFRKLKFQRLLHRIAQAPDGALEIEIDGPFSLFDSVTKYGLALANAFSAIVACGHWTLVADVRWGKKRDPLVFSLQGERLPDDDEGPRLRDDVEQLLERFAARDKSGWDVAVSDEVLELPGVGLCVPDLRFTKKDSGEVVLLEVLGFWSRDAVWRRVELARAGLEQKVLFAVSKRLRVSEAVLDADVPAALYVYKGVMSPKQIEDRLETLI